MGNFSWVSANFHCIIVNINTLENGFLQYIKCARKVYWLCLSMSPDPRQELINSQSCYRNLAVRSCCGSSLLIILGLDQDISDGVWAAWLKFLAKAKLQNQLLLVAVEASCTSDRTSHLFIVDKCKNITRSNKSHFQHLVHHKCNNYRANMSHVM